mgnify:CR=1 FL=1
MKTAAPMDLFNLAMIFHGRDARATSGCPLKMLPLPQKYGHTQLFCRVASFIIEKGNWMGAHLPVPAVIRAEIVNCL